MIIAVSLLSWEFAPQVFIGLFIMGVCMIATMEETNHTGIVKGQIWKNNFTGLKARIIKREHLERSVIIYFIVEGEHQERQLPYNLFLTQYTQLSR